MAHKFVYLLSPKEKKSKLGEWMNSFGAYGEVLLNKTIGKV